MEGFQFTHLVLGLPALVAAIAAAAFFGVPFKKAESAAEWVALGLLFGAAVFVTLYFS